MTNERNAPERVHLYHGFANEWRMIDSPERLALAKRCDALLVEYIPAAALDAEREKRVRAEAERDAAQADAERYKAALERLVTAKALKDVRSTVAGWNGENRPEGPFAERHPTRLGATLPKTNCGAVYDLDDAMQAARAALNPQPTKGAEG